MQRCLKFVYKMYENLYLCLIYIKMRMRKIEICVLNILKREDLEYKVNLMLYLDVYMLK